MTSSLYHAFYLITGGLILGMTGCMAGVCVPAISLYVLSESKRFGEFTGKFILFFLGKTAGYFLLAVLFFSFKSATLNILDDYRLLVGFFFVFIGIVVIFSKDKCIIIKNNNIFLVGFFSAIVPCAPLIGILSYIVLVSKSFYTAVFYSVLFSCASILPLFVVFGSMFILKKRMPIRYNTVLRGVLRKGLGLLFCFYGFGMLL